MRVEIKELAVAPEVDIPVQGRLGGQHGANRVLAELGAVVGLGLAVELTAVVPALRHLVLILVAGDVFIRQPVVQRESERKLARFALLVVVGDLALELQALQERSGIRGAQAVHEGRDRGLVITVGTVQGADRVTALVTGVVGPVRRVRRHLPGNPALRVQTAGVEVLVRVGRRTHLVVPAQAGLEHHLEVLRHVRRDVALEGEALVAQLRAVQDAVIRVERAGEVVLRLIITTVDGNLVVHLRGMLPVELGVPLVVRIARVTVLVMVDEVLGIRERLAHEGVHRVRLLEPGHDVHLFREGGRDTEGEPVGVLHRRRADGALLGGHEDDTVLGAHTVDGGGGVLQDGDALDVLRVQLRQDGGAGVGVGGVGLLAAARRRPDDAVHDDERFVIAAELEVGVEVTGVTRALADLQARDLALEGGQHVGLLGRREFLAPDVGDGAGQGRLLLGAIAHDDRLLDHGDVLLHDDVERRRRGHFLGDEADGRDHERGSPRDYDGELTVQIGGYAGVLVLRHDVRADERLSVCIRDRTLHGNRSLSEDYLYARQHTRH